MSQELAAQNNSDDRYLALFDELKPVLEPVAAEDFIDSAEIPVLCDRLKDTFSDDYAGVLKFADLLFDEKVPDFGGKVTKLFTGWEQGGECPNLTGFVAVTIDKMGLDTADTLVKGIFASAILAEYPNNLQYHGNLHYRKVLFHTIRLMVSHNNIFKDTNRALTKDHMAKLLIAACIHDLGHMGGDNLKEGVYTPGFMEQRANMIINPYLEALGVQRDDLQDMETMVFCTDITFFAGDNSPCIRMKKIYKHYFWDDDKEDVSMMMMGKLRRFEDNPRLVIMAMLLHEADIATSAGLSYEQTQKETINILGERGIDTAGPRTVLAFLREQLGETLFTEAGKQIYGKVMSEVISKAEKDIEEGREVFEMPK